VQADLGFLNDFLPAAAAQPVLQQDALESMLFGVEQCVNISSDAPKPDPDWQERPPESEINRVPPSRDGVWFWLSRILGQCLPNCMLDACCSGLGCLTGPCKRPGAV
jgi:hypothetical protein